MGYRLWVIVSRLIGRVQIVLFLLLLSTAVEAQRPVKRVVRKPQVTKKTTNSRSTQTTRKTATVRKTQTTPKTQTSQKTPAAPAKPAAPVKPLTVSNEPVISAVADTSELSLDDSLKIKHLEVPVTPIPNKLDSLLKAHIDNKFVRRIDSVLHTKQARQRIVAGMQRAIRLDSILTERYKKYDADRNYVIRPPERITFKVNISSLGTSMSSTGRMDDGKKTHTKLTADFKNSMNFSATYRGITLGGSIDPTRIFKKNKDVEFNIVSYGNRFGLDAVYQRANSFNGHATIDGKRYNIPGGNVRQTMIAGNAYYVFNYRKFSYAAAFSQSFIQRRSAGSILLGLSFLSRKTKSNYNIEALTNGELQQEETPELTTQHSIVLRGTNIGAGVGYGYNWVPHRRWLIHISLLPTLMILNTNKQTINGEDNRIPYRFPQAIITGRSALVYSFHNMFVGGSFVATNSDFGKRSDLKITTLRWQAQVFWGARLWK